jgi:hypothetical protein
MNPDAAERGWSSEETVPASWKQVSKGYVVSDNLAFLPRSQPHQQQQQSGAAGK